MREAFNGGGSSDILLFGQVQGYTRVCIIPSFNRQLTDLHMFPNNLSLDSFL